VTSCAHGVPAHLERERALWERSSTVNYQYVYSLSIAACAAPGTALVTVRHGAVTSTRTLTGRCTELGSVPTIDAMFARLGSEYRQGFHVVVTYDPIYGFPTTANVVKRGVLDDWSDEGASGYKPLP
jgi:hypothetical protein